MNTYNRLAMSIATLSLSVSSVASITDPGAINWGPVKVIPMVDFGVGHSDNVYRKGSGDLKEKSATIYQLKPSVAFMAQQGLSTYTLNLSARKKMHSGESDADFLDYGANIEVYEDFNSRNRLTFTGGYGVYHDEGTARGGAADKEAPEYENKQLGLIYGFGGEDAIGRIDFFGQYSSRDYDEFTLNGTKRNSGADRTNKELGTTFYYRLMPKTDALLEAKKREIKYDNYNSSGLDIISYLIGLRWDATAKTSGYAKVGRRTRKAEANNVSDENYTGWELGVIYQPLTYSQIELSSGRDYGLESEDQTQRNYTKGTTSAIKWSHHWSAVINSHLGFSHSDLDIQTAAGATNKTQTTETWTVGIDWSPMRNLSLGLSWQSTDKNEKVKTTGATADEYRQQQYMLTASWSL